MFYIFFWLPGIVRFGVPFPLYEIMELSVWSGPFRIQNLLDFILFLPFYDVRWWFQVIGSMSFGLVIRGQQTGVENVVDSFLFPLRR